MGLLVVLFLGIYYFQFQTYFINQEVNENIPETKDESKPRITKQGVFIDSDFIHRGSGKVSILSYSDGRRVLRIEDLDITNGPDLYIYLSKTLEPKSDIESLGEYYNLGALKGNMGDQNYEIPKEVKDFNSVVIWCKKFDVLFPYAVLK